MTDYEEMTFAAEEAVRESDAKFAREQRVFARINFGLNAALCLTFIAWIAHGILA